MRRRFPQNGATTSDLDRNSGSRISPIGAGGLSVTPLIERERVSDPTIEAAKIAAKRFFSKPGSPQSARADHWSDPSKSLFATRPIFHKVDETIRGHVSCSFLALVLKKELEERIADLGRNGSWPDILADLDSLTETKVEQDDKCFLLRSPPRPAASSPPPVSRCRPPSAKSTRPDRRRRPPQM
jgi:hypothetical protein